MCMSLSLTFFWRILGYVHSNLQGKSRKNLQFSPRKKVRWVGSGLYLTPEFLKSGCVTHEKPRVYENIKVGKGKEKQNIFK